MHGDTRRALALVVLLAGCHGADPALGGAPDATTDGGTASDGGASCVPPPADFVVATDGDDSGPGTLGAPFATLQRAQTAVRTVSRAGRTTPITVLVRGGTYAQTATWKLTAADSGTPTVPIVYEAYPCETPVISGGMAIDSWTAAADGTLTAPVPATASFAQLWVNDVRRFRPRALAGAYGTIDAPTSAGFHYTDATAFSPSWHNLGDVEVVVFEKWTVSRQRVVSVDGATQTVTTTKFTDGDGSHAYIQDHRYLVENVKEMLAPGEFYLDTASHVLTYAPAPGETATTVHAIAPVLSQIVAADHLTDTTFRGLAFSHSSFAIGADGYQAAQSLWDVPPAVLVADSVRVTFDGCMFRHLGALGVDFEGSGGFAPSAATPFANELLNSELSDLGAGALRIGYKNAAPYAVTEATATQGVHVANNVITGGGRFLPSAQAIVVGEAHDNLIEHNEISDFYQSAISVGYTFAQQPKNANGSIDNGAVATYPATLAHDNVIKNNLIHDIGRGVTDDLGGIYLLTGSSTGNVVTGNVVHDIINSPQAVGYGANGLYYDQGTSNVLSQYNLVYRTSDASLQQNTGRANVFTNNIFYAGRLGVYHHHYYEPTNILWATFMHNIVVYDKGTFLDDGWHCPTGSDCRSSFDFHDNDDFDSATAIAYKPQAPAASFTLPQFQSMESEELGSIAVDPGFTNPTFGHDDFTLAPDSPALAVGFKPFEISAAGRTSPVLLPPPAPVAFPLQEPADPSTFY